jgi:epoxide hydrolase-like predicted phosphatase
MNKKIKAVIFDVGGVLAINKKPMIYKRNRYVDIGVHEYISRKLKISVDQWFDSIELIYSLSVEGKISPSEILKTFSKNNQIRPSKLSKIILKGYKKNFKQNKQLFKRAFKLKKIGYKIAIISDQWFLSKKALMPIKNFKNFFPVIVSCEVGTRKPRKKIYQITLKKLNLKPEECLFIDNQKWNLETAKKLGMKIILFKNNKQLFKHPLWKRLQK